MKKVIALLILTVLLVNAAVISASAATADDVLTEIAKNPVYKYIETDIKNLARSYTFTAEQYDQLLDVAKEANKVITTDNGYNSEKYSADVIKNVTTLLDKACAITGFTYVLSETEAKHPGDIVIKIFDKSGKIVYIYDGDVIKTTSSDVAVQSTDIKTNAVLAAVGVLAAAGLAAVCVSGRKNRYTA